MRSCSSRRLRMIVGRTPERAGALGQRPPARPGVGRSEQLAPAGQNLVQRLPEVPGGLGHVAPDLLGVLLLALPDLVLEQLLERSVPEPLLPLGGMVDHDVGDQRAGQPPGLWAGSWERNGLTGRPATGAAAGSEPAAVCAGTGRGGGGAAGGGGSGRGLPPGRPARGGPPAVRARRGGASGRAGGAPARRPNRARPVPGRCRRGARASRRRRRRAAAAGGARRRERSEPAWRPGRVTPARGRQRLRGAVPAAAMPPAVVRPRRSARLPSRCTPNTALQTAAARPHARLGHLGRVHPEDGGAVGAGHVHRVCPHGAPGTPVPGRSSPFVPCRRSTTNTDPGSVLA